MSGETEKDVSGWTVDTLAQHVAELMGANDRRYSERFDAQEKALADALLAAKEAGAAAISTTKEAVTKAENANEKRFESVNEFRNTLKDQATHFLTRTESVAVTAPLERAVEALRVELATYTAGTSAYERQSSVERGQLDKRLESMNEFRAQLKDQALTFMTRSESIVIEGSIKDDIKRLAIAITGTVPREEVQAVRERFDSRVKFIEEKLANWDGRLWAFGGVFTIANVLLSWWLSHH